MDLELLRTFLEVNHYRHFGRAGEALSLTQAAISARIRSLEGQLGVKLFERRYHDIQLTPEGHRLIRHADKLLSGWRKARQEVTFGDADQQLTMGGSPRIWDVALQTWLHTVRRTLPDLAIIAELHTPDILTRRLLDGHLDVAFMLEPPQLELLQIQEVAQIDLVLVSSKKGSSTEDALSDGYIMVDWGLAHALQHRRFYPDASEPKLKVAQAKMALGQLLELGGSAYLPGRMIVDEIAQNKLFLVDAAMPITRIAYAVYPLRSNKLELIQKVLKLFEYFVNVGSD